MLQAFIDEALEHHKAGRFKPAIQMYNQVLNQFPYDDQTRFLLADAYSRIEFNGLAINLLHNVLQSRPDYPEGWCNLGVALRKELFHSQAEEAWNRALELQGDTAEVCGNMAGLYADSGKPDEAIQWCDRALACDPDNAQAKWQKALALLTKGDFAAGWPLYEARKQLPGWDSRPSVVAPNWDGGPVKHLYIHGEQGVGDEIMFGTCLSIAIEKAEKVTIEVNPAVAGLFARTWPHAHIVIMEAPGCYDAKVAMGSLPGLMGVHRCEYLKPSPKTIAYYRDKLEELGPGPYIGLAWVGGMKQTRVVDRTIPLSLLEPIREIGTCVSVQYEHTNPMIGPERERAGLPLIDMESAGKDLHAQAALMAALDAVVTVQQTAVHVAGAVGTPCYALIPQSPQWRYGLTGETMPWYRSVRLFRQGSGENWGAVVARIADELHVGLDTREAA